MIDALLIQLLLVVISLQLILILMECMRAEWPKGRVGRFHRRTARRRVFPSDETPTAAGDDDKGSQWSRTRDPGAGESSWPSFLLN